MIRDAFHGLLSGTLSRRQFLSRLSALGVGAAAAAEVAAFLAPARAAESAGHLTLSNASGGKITCEMLKLWDIDYVFGNTGAYEAGLLDALVDYPGIQYVLGLHEGAVMAMADGYARATGRTAFVNVHSITGTANALGLMVNAWADSSPVVVTVGFSASRGENLGVFTETAKIETVPELFTKLSFRSSRIENLGESLRRAFRLASARPPGPVFLGVTADVWAEQSPRTELIPARRSISSARLPPDQSALRTAAEWLAAAVNPLLIAGAELPRWGGLTELVQISDLLGATVSGDTAASRSSMGFPSGHPRYLGPLRAALKPPTPYDVVLIAGASRLTLARSGHPLIPTDAKIIELGIREDHLARAYPADLLIYADPELALAGLLEALKEQRIDAEAADERAEAGAAMKAERVKGRQALLRRVWDSEPIAPERLAFEIDRAINAQAIVVTEGVSSDAPIRDYVRFDQPGGGRRHLISSGGSLGWGLGAGVGAKLGVPDKQVAVLLGDGSYQFGVHAIWTASHIETPLIIVIFNNRAYQANRWALAGLKGRAAETDRYIGINLVDPDIDHVAIARAYGFEGERVAKPRDLSAALQRAVTSERNGRGYVLDVIIDRRGAGAKATWHEAQAWGG